MIYETNRSDGRTALHGDTAYRTTTSTALLRLAALSYDADAEEDVDAAIAGILALLGDSLGVGVTFLARVANEALHVEHAYDRAEMGLTAGAVVPLCDSY